MQTIRGHLFDIYHIEDKIYLAILDEQQKFHLFTDSYFPKLYLCGPEQLLRKFILRLKELDAIRKPPQWKQKIHFYSNQPLQALEVEITKPSVLRSIYKKIYAFYHKMDIYHSDIEIPTGYMFSKGIFPMGKLEIEFEEDKSEKKIQSIQSLESIRETDYTLPPLRVLQIRLEKTHRLGLRSNNPLILTWEQKEYKLEFHSAKTFLESFNRFLKDSDPDLILSNHGDQIIFPTLFAMAQNTHTKLALDRDQTFATTRKIITKGSSYNTYGNMIYRAPSYPLFGRWHIDKHNSFTYKESELYGVIELARLSRLPVQRMARSSTGTALTSIETSVALQRNYLVPWQKSAVEESKTIYQLLQIDKGGLIYLPDSNNGYLYENVAQLDFSQMYPSIMVNHNISPECVNCSCCKEDPLAPKVPGTHYHICNKRKGVVSLSLRHILARRKHYKQRKKQASGLELEILESKQSSLKWMLVTSFGYLGYRNAKFGRLESHESVTAYGREKLIQAKETAEDSGYKLLHGITDCIFIQKPDGTPFTTEELDSLCSKIGEKTGIEMGKDGVYSWLVFPISRMDAGLGVPNRYFGRFQTGEMKVRGLLVRRKDTPEWIKEVQVNFLDRMSLCKSVRELRSIQNEIWSAYQNYESELRLGKVDWRKLLIRRTAGSTKDEYQVQNSTFLALQELSESGMEVEAGEKVRYLVLNQIHPDSKKRYATEEYLLTRLTQPTYDKLYYKKQLQMAFKEIAEHVWPDLVSDGQRELFGT